MIELAGRNHDPDALRAPTPLYDYRAEAISAFLHQCGYSADDDIIDSLTQIHDEVRDAISYTVFGVPLDAGLSAAGVASAQTGFCLHKSILFVALCRRIGVPAVLCSDTVTNHVSDESMRTLVGGDRFLHWYTRVYVDGRWVKAAPIFDSLLCNLYGIDVVEFDVRLDDIRQMDQEGNRMRYAGNEKIYINPDMGDLLAEIQRLHPLMVTADGRTPRPYQLRSAHRNNKGVSSDVE